MKEIDNFDEQILFLFVLNCITCYGNQQKPLRDYHGAYNLLQSHWALILYGGFYLKKNLPSISFPLFIYSFD